MQTATGDSEFGEPSLLAEDQQDIILEDVGSAGEVVRVKVLVTNGVGEAESEEETVTLLSEGK